MSYRLVIDRVKCESNGRCIRAAAGLIQPGGDGSPDIGHTLFGFTEEALVRAAVAACPMAALWVEEVADN
jgi:ferredoxin